MNERCGWTETLATAYVAGELRGIDRFRFDRHMGGCESCRLAVPEMQEALVALGRLVGPRVSSGARDRLLAVGQALLPEVVEETRRSTMLRPIPWFAGAGAAALAAVLVAFLLLGPLRPMRVVQPDREDELRSWDSETAAVAALGEKLARLRSFEHPGDSRAGESLGVSRDDASLADLWFEVRRLEGPRRDRQEDNGNG